MDDDIKPRSIPPQNIVLKLIHRETWGARKPGTHLHLARSFYTNIYPNFTVLNVDKPPCFLRKFSPDGLYFIAFSADQTSLEIYNYRGSAAAADLLYTFDEEVVGNSYHSENNYLRNTIFDRFFQLRSIVNVAESTDHQLNRECSLFTDDGKYVIIGSAAFIPEDIPPLFYNIYTNNEGVTPNTRCPLEDITLYLIDLKAGLLCDKIRYDVDKVYLSHNQGIYLFKDRLAVLSIQHQTIHVYLIRNGQFTHIRSIGRFCYENDDMLITAHLNNREIYPFIEKTINCLKHRLLVFLFKRAYDAYIKDKNYYALRKFYMHFDQFNELRLWKMQMIDENHFLLKYASEEVVVMKTAEPNSQPCIFVIYNMETTEVLAVYDNTSEDLLHILENFTEYFRNSRLSVESQFTCSPCNNIYARLGLDRFKQTIISARYGGPTEATKRLLAQLPISAQSYTSSPYLDLSLFSYNDKWVSPMERPKACGEYPIRFFERKSALLKFKIHASILGRNVPPPRRLVAFIFHPTDPFAISVQRTNSDYVVNFHVRNVYADE